MTFEGEQGVFGVGRVLYKMRMRKPLDEALKWYQQNKTLQQQRNPVTSKVNAYKKKNVTVKVTQALGLKHAQSAKVTKLMRPYFSYCFYSFADVFSATNDGSNPNFNSVKYFEVETSP